VPRVSAYMLWVRDNRPSIVEELRRDPSWKEKSNAERLGELQRAVTKKWVGLEIEVKIKYEATAAAEKAAKKPVDTSRLKELQTLRAQVRLPTADLPSAAHTLFLQDAAERARIAVESLGEESVMAKMQKQWSSMLDEQKTAWESMARISKLHDWEQSAEGLELKKLDEKKRISDAALAVAFQPPAVPVKHCKGRGKGRGNGRAMGKGRGKGRCKNTGSVRGKGRGGKGGQRETGITDMATSTSCAPDVLSTPSKKRSRAPDVLSTPSKKHLREEPITESCSTPLRPDAPQEHCQKVDLASVGLDEELLKRARRKGLQAPLLLLAHRNEIRALGLPGFELFEAIKKSGGLVNAAKYSILSARCSTP